MAAFSRYVKEVRRAQAMSQTELAELAGVEQPTVSGWETGRRGITSDAIDRVLDALDVEPERAFRRLAEIMRQLRTSRGAPSASTEADDSDLAESGEDER